MKFKPFIVLIFSIILFLTQTIFVFSDSKEALWIVTDSSGTEWCKFPFSRDSTDETAQAIRKVGKYVLCNEYGLSSNDTMVTEKYNIVLPNGNATLDGKKICIINWQETPCSSTEGTGTISPSINNSTGTVIPRKRNVRRKVVVDDTQVQSGALSESWSLMNDMSNPNSRELSGKTISANKWLWGILIFFAIIGKVIMIINLIIFLLMAWGLYLINKKSWEKYPWLAFIPLVQMYSFVKAGGKDGIWVLWIILGSLFFGIPGLILYIIVIHGTSKRTGNGIGTTILAIFFPYIMYPIMGSKMLDRWVKTETGTETGTGTETEIEIL